MLAALKALIAFGSVNVSEAKLADVLSSDEGGDAALRLLATTVHRLRKLLGDAEAIIVNDSRISLNPDRVWVDIRALEHTTITRAMRVLTYG